MSTTIEFNRYAIAVPSGPDPAAEWLVLGVAERGDNNRLEENGRIARHYDTVALTGRIDFMREVMRTAMHCEGGELRVHGQRTTPERYIKAWRKAVSQAVTIDSFLQYGDLQLTVRPSAQELLQERIDQDKALKANGLKRYTRLLDRLDRCDGIRKTSRWHPIEKRDVTSTEFQMSLTNKQSTIACLQELIDLGPPRMRVSCERFNSVAWGLARSCESTAVSALSPV
jgi:hypothetical protein